MAGERRFHGPSDLHTHSSVSDGTETPSRLVRSASAAGLGTVALTDHDSTAGWSEAAVAARSEGITLIPGMEFSTRLGYRSIHLLAYLFDPSDGDLVTEMARIREARLVRAERIVQNLSRDYALTWDDVVAQTTDGATIGRPHIADALVARGHVPTRSEAFASILHPSRGYFLPHYAPDPVDAVRLVVAAGGVPVIAHPATRGPGLIVSDRDVEDLVGAGLAGLEIDHRENTASGKQAIRRLAGRHGLILTGSSDYHGTGKPNLLGENTTSDDSVAAIIERGTGSEPVYGRAVEDPARA
ncbi:PHP domain-containing protein [Labedella phragmitis]|uniref:PHP domain-containing protein n=1 Tax=Labedella phragmitis TaxID=2498849 RepID=A0A3S3ZN49_9MICO|nr:PHP domain-containing protein [Labedella phragmitis]RWZ49689.1 PHP domain-containing protein [Labedella phragmitis]